MSGPVLGWPICCYIPGYSDIFVTSSSRFANYHIVFTFCAVELIHHIQEYLRRSKKRSKYYDYFPEPLGQLKDVLIKLNYRY